MNESRLHIIGKGGHGCVFQPALTCQGKLTTAKYLTKFNQHKDVVMQEKHMSDRIRKIPGYHSIAAPIIKTCSTRLKKLKSYESTLKQCEFVKKITDSESAPEETKLYLQTMRKIDGPLLDDYLLDIHGPKRDVRKKYVDIFASNIYLLKSFEKFLENGIVHYDFKFNNVLFDQKLKVPILIDFGLSIHIPSLRFETNRNFFFSFSGYSFWCIDICVCSYIFKEEHGDIMVESDVNAILNVFVHGNPNKKRVRPNDVLVSFIFAEEFGERTIEKFRQYLMQFVGMQWIKVYEMLLKCHSTWDLYSLAVSNVFLLEDMHPEYLLRMKSFSPEIYHSFVSLLEEIVGANPSERISLSAAKEKFNELKQKLKERRRRH